MTLFRLIAGAAAGVLLAGVSQAAPISLDEFNGPEQSLSVNNTDTTDTQLDNNGMGANAGILGGYRDIGLEWVSGQGSSSATVDFSDNNFFAHNQESQVASQTTLTWNGLGGAGLNADLSAGMGLVITLLQSDEGLRWLFTIDDGDSSHEARVDTVEVNPGDPATTLFLSFKAFSDFGNLNLGNVQSISLLANETSVEDLDVSVDSIRIAVPEPATLGVLGAGLIGLGAAVRRRRTA